MSESVLIARKRLLPYSETFVAAQATGLQTFTPVFAGLKEEPSGKHLLSGYPVLLQDKFARFPAISRGLLSSRGIPNGRWLSAIKEHQPSIVHAHFGPNGALGLALAKALDLPLVVTFHGYDITRFNVDKRYQKSRQRLFEQADRIIAVSDFIRAKLIETGCPPSLVTRHYIGLDMRPSDQSATSQVIDKSSFPHLIFVGRLVKQKGCMHVISAMKKIREIHASARLDVVGDGPEIDALKNQARPIGGIQFLGRLSPEDVRQLLAQAWVLCNPSVVDSSGATEGLGMVFLEAQAAGTPAVSFDSGGIPEAIVDGKTGFTVPMDNNGMLVARVLELLGNPKRRQSMGRAGQKHVQEYFDLRTQCESLEHLYREVISGHRV